MFKRVLIRNFTICKLTILSRYLKASSCNLHFLRYYLQRCFFCFYFFCINYLLKVFNCIVYCYALKIAIWQRDKMVGSIFMFFVVTNKNIRVAVLPMFLKRIKCTGTKHVQLSSTIYNFIFSLPGAKRTCVQPMFLYRQPNYYLQHPVHECLKKHHH